VSSWIRISAQKQKGNHSPKALLATIHSQRKAVVKLQKKKEACNQGGLTTGKKRGGVGPGRKGEEGVLFGHQKEEDLPRTKRAKSHVRSSGKKGGAGTIKGDPKH